MPIHEFNCPKCKASFEELVFGEDIPPCPKCGYTKTEKLISCATLHMPTPSRVGQAMPMAAPSSRSACSTCTSTNCSSCGS